MDAPGYNREEHLAYTAQHNESLPKDWNIREDDLSDVLIRDSAWMNANITFPSIPPLCWNMPDAPLPSQKLNANAPPMTLIILQWLLGVGGRDVATLARKAWNSHRHLILNAFLDNDDIAVALQSMMLRVNPANVTYETLIGNAFAYHGSLDPGQEEIDRWHAASFVVFMIPEYSGSVDVAVATDHWMLGVWNPIGCGYPCRSCSSSIPHIH